MAIPKSARTNSAPPPSALPPPLAQRRPNTWRLENGCRRRRALSICGFLLAQARPRSPVRSANCRRLRKRSGSRGAAPPMALAIALPNDPLIGSLGPVAVDPATGLESQWYLHRTRVPAAWRFTGCQRRHRRHRLGLSDDASGPERRGQRKPTTPLTATRGPRGECGTWDRGARYRRRARQRDRDRRLRSRSRAVGDPGRQLVERPAVFTEPWTEAIDFVRRTDEGRAQGHHPRSANRDWRQLRADSRQCTAPFARPLPTAASSVLPPETAAGRPIAMTPTSRLSLPVRYSSAQPNITRPRTSERSSATSAAA